MDDVTRLPTDATPVLTGPTAGWGRFPAGALLAGRFRIVAPLERGGTGEVHRADDLKLGQKLLQLPVPAPQVPVPLVLLGARYALDGALETVPRAVQNALQIVCVLVFLRIILQVTWLVLLLGVMAILPIAITGTVTTDRLVITLAIAVAGIALVFFVLLRFGLLALVVMFSTSLTMDIFPLTTDLSRPYAGTSIVLLLAIAGGADLNC
jgi:hypothetical protein